MGEYSHVFQPLKIGGMTVRNRIEMAPVGPLLAVNGLVTRELVEWGRALARGGAAIVTIGDSSVQPPEVLPPTVALNLGSDAAVNPLSVFAETVKRYGARASIQLNRHGDAIPDALSRQEIKGIVEEFAAAAHRCLRAGMDMVMVHGAHGQLISRFVSPRLNLRTDDYGGTLENRARLVTEILEGIRDRVGDRLGVEYRISAEEFVPDGLKLEEQLEFARLIQDRIDLLHVSAGMLFTPETLPRMIQPTYYPRGINVDYAAAFKRALKVPVSAVGSLDMAKAEEIIAAGSADMAAMARTLLADPECVNKAGQGREKETRPCVRCNTCINRTHGHRLPVRCAVNPYLGREAEFVNALPAPSSKKLVVIGGGPAGMEAARTAAGRGHEVVLFEKAAQLGGTLAYAAAAPFKKDMNAYLDWAVRSTLAASGVDIRLSTEATPAAVQVENPDILVIAAGSEPLVPELPGIDRENVVRAGDVSSGRAVVGNRVVVAGAGLTGSETALFLSQQGKQVTLIDVLPLAEIDAAHPFINITALRALLRESGAATIDEVKLESIGDPGVVIVDKIGRRREISYDTVVLALGMVPRADIIAKFRGLAPKIVAAGDCNNRHGNLYTAVAEGFFAGADA